MAANKWKYRLTQVDNIIFNIFYNEKIYLDAGIDAPIDIIVRKEPKTRRGFNLTASAKRALSSITSRREKKEHGLKPYESFKEKTFFLHLGQTNQL